MSTLTVPPLVYKHAGFRRWKSRIVLGLMGGGLALCMVPLMSLLYTLLVNGLPVIGTKFLTCGWGPVGETNGIAHAILGSLYMLGVALLIAGPLGIAKGIYLAQHGGTRVARTSRLLLDVMTGIPAIIVGVFVYTLVVRPVTGYSLLAGAIALAMIMLPIVARTTEEALKQIPNTVDEAGLALGLPRRKVVFRIVLRAAMPAVLSGMFLAVARVAGEAAPLLFTSMTSNYYPSSPLKSSNALPALLFDYYSAPYPERVAQAWGAALILVVLILASRVLTHVYIFRRYGKSA